MGEIMRGDRAEGVCALEIWGEQWFERFFENAANLDVDKQDVKRYQDFINEQIYDLLVMGAATANAEGKDIIEPQHLPITKGLQESIQQFEQMEEQEFELQPILDQVMSRPPLERTPSAETEAQLTSIAGGLSLALAQSFKIMDTKLKNPHSDDWDRAFKVFNLLV